MMTILNICPGFIMCQALFYAPHMYDTKSYMFTIHVDTIHVHTYMLIFTITLSLPSIEQEKEIAI